MAENVTIATDQATNVVDPKVLKGNNKSMSHILFYYAYKPRIQPLENRQMAELLKQQNHNLNSTTDISTAKQHVCLKLEKP